jgi:hypothetical protein
MADRRDRDVSGTGRHVALQNCIFVGFVAANPYLRIVG